jgi:putative glutamine amidotransferase
MKPIIGITSMLEFKPKKQYSVISKGYNDSVILAGGVPIAIPCDAKIEDCDVYLDKIDALIISGGEDIAPFLYGEAPIKEVTYVIPERDYLEIELVKKAIEKNIPILGICRGMQIINISLGGTLYQDINTQANSKIEHMPMSMPIDRIYHRIKIEENSLLMDIFKEKEILVNSFHHQAVKDLGKGLIATAFSEDGFIEGIEAEGNKNIIGVQFHPEDLTKNYPIFIELFKYIVKRD